MAENTSTGRSGGKDAFGDFAPGMVHYTDRVLLVQRPSRHDAPPRVAPSPMCAGSRFASTRQESGA
ncbi:MULTISPECIES: hypothetical protein [Streptomyces]|uniref:Uncharacterized protein n=1 Tax=Streptomyces lienomycini TaxID=284035 RepID=A0ABV9X8F1_9ACTN|nr:hypothetical protein [Streptomyces sp. NBC_00334]